MSSRTEELAANLAGVRARIAAACAPAKRSADDVTLLAVTKTWPADDLRILAELGLRDMGENRHQDAAEKAAALTNLNLRWHFVGQLQTNKARAVATYADVIHSVDRERLIAPLAAGATDTGRTVDVFVQVSLDGAQGRGGAAPAAVPDIAAAVASAEGLRLAGVMAVAPLGADALSSYQKLARISADLRVTHPHAAGISAGMSGDLEAAISAGSTVVRVGTALLGGRPPFVG